uniref:snRNA-activating protein complex subunit 2 n=1 Tax=Monopterus albus TaxID=43700 RepID=A0A3Q3IRF5_MONAL
MKPPPRTRNKPERIFIPEQVSQRSGKVPSKWRRAEKIKFLSALKRLQRPAGCLEDIDCAFLAKYLPTRSISEIRSFVEDMKNEVITRASFNLKKKRWKEKNDRKPIEVWTDMASTMAGTYEQSISSAFSQMLLVSSTEPRTLRNCDPPQIYRSPSDKDSSAIPGCSYTHTTPLLSASATECQARFGRTSKYATKDSPRTFGVSSVVDFEKIYRYLSVINKPNERCPLSPMESAVVLDLLMSLPQELSLLDCNKLHKHLIQVYKCLSSPADSKVAREMFKDLQWNGPSAQTEAPIGQDSKGTDSEQNTACQEGDADVMGPCPPLNPFMVPIKLLMRK